MATELENGLRIRIGLELKTNRGLVSMIGPVYETAEGVSDIISAAMGIISYPDQRVTKFRIYACQVVSSSEGDWYVWEYAALKSNKNELAYAKFAEEIGSTGVYGVPWATFSADATKKITASAINAIPSTVSEADPNLVLVSDPYQPRMLYARSALTIGNDADDEVLAFETNAVPVSSGQYGEYPVAAFCRRSIWSLRAGESDVPFTSIAPMTTHKRIVGRKAIANIGGQVFYMATDGLYRLGDRVPVSALIQNSGNANDLLNPDVLTDSATIGYFVDPTSGRREIWVSTKPRIYAYALEHGVWFTLEGARKQFLTAFGELWGMDTGGIVREAGTVGGDSCTGKILSTPIHMGAPEVLKRFRKVIVRFSGSDVVSYTQVTDYDLTVQVIGATQPLISFDFQFEPRYTHRVRIKRSSRIVMSVVSPDGTQQFLDLSDLQAQLADLDSSILFLSTEAQALSAQATRLQTLVPVAYSGRVTGVNETGASIVFPAPFGSADDYLPIIFALSGDGLRTVSVRAELSATGMTFTPAEDSTTIYWRVEGF
jgi:hypothetical protein